MNKILETVKEDLSLYDKLIDTINGTEEEDVKEEMQKHIPNIEMRKKYRIKQTIKLLESVIERLNEKNIGKGKNENFDDGAYFENTQITKEIEDVIKEIKK